jgi:hypothetical protein
MASSLVLAGCAPSIASDCEYIFDRVNKMIQEYGRTDNYDEHASAATSSRTVLFGLASKSFQSTELQEAVDTMIEAGLDRADTVLALGDNYRGKVDAFDLATAKLARVCGYSNE